VNCEQANNLIGMRIDGEIAANDLAALDAHLATCRACRAVADALTAQDVELERAFAPRRATAALLAERIITQLDEVVPSPAKETLHPTQQRSWWASWGKPLAAAAAGFGLAIILTHPWNAGNTRTAGVPVTVPSSVTSQGAVKPVMASLGQLALATGAVFVCPADSQHWRPLESGGAVQAGMRVRTGPKVRCEFKLDDGSEVRMNADTEITLPAPRRVEVAGGQVFSSVQKQVDGAPFVVNAAPAQTTLTALGTAFDVTCQPGKATLTVVEGSVKVEAAGDENVIRGGEALTVSDGRFGDKKTVDNLMRATQWVDEILVLKGRDNPELARRIDDIFAQLGHEKMWYMQAQEVRRLGDHCIVPLTRYIQSDRSKSNASEEMKRREAARIIGDVATTWAIPELINLLADNDGEVRYSAAQALQRLTGQSLGRRPEQWRDQPWMACAPSIDQWHNWWEQNKAKFPGADPDAVKPVEVVKKEVVPNKKG
jgi:ferric-dicitrate binding protein FerR (iron transport regulator)